MLIAAAILAIFVYGVIAAMLGTLLPTFKFTGPESGSIALAQSIGLVIASLSAGPIIDNKGKKTALVSGLFLIAAVLWALPNVAGFTMVAVLLFILGLGGGIIVTAANALVGDIKYGNRSTISNLMNLFFGVGSMATPLLSANLFDNNAQSLCYFAAVMASITFVVHMATKMPPPTGEQGFKVAEIGLLVSRPALWLLSLILFMYVACEVGVFNWLSSYLIAKGVPEAEAQNILGWRFAGGLVIGRVLAAGILTRIPGITVLMGAAAAMAASTYWMLADPASAGIAVLCAGIAMAPVFPTVLGLVGDAFPVATATAMGIVITCGWIGLTVSSSIIGSIAGEDKSNLPAALNIFPICSVIMLVLLVVLSMVQKKPAASAARA
ncbi:hypothetical protein F183_A18150 [Bryobacterales bacterium F-183]|nr:hypothetical protein F183_A18150 [Bryobacterales bacterium F-183]